MTVASEYIYLKIVSLMVGVQFTPGQATKLKNYIDAVTDHRTECPCSRCRPALCR